jgi:hypothetical protein
MDLVVSSPRASIFVNPNYYRKYFCQSQHFLLLKKFDIEIVHQPFKQLNPQILPALWNVLMKSCDKNEQDEANYREKINIEKVGINVDALILVSLNNQLVAFTSGSFIGESIFYINAAMVLAEYQAYSLGGIITCMMALNSVIHNAQLGIKETSLICRTQNQNAARLFIHACHNAKVSTEKLNRKERKVLEKTTGFLHCHIDFKTGITRDVYPEGLPKGGDAHDQRVTDAFRSLNATDACYVMGFLKIEMVARLLKGILSASPKAIFPVLSTG